LFNPARLVAGLTSNSGIFTPPWERRRLAGSPFGNVEGAELAQEQRQFAWLLAISFCNSEYKPARRRRSQENVVILQFSAFSAVTIDLVTINFIVAGH
jgi:hypothetical protein